MNVIEYLKQGRYWKDRNKPTDGCSFVGWLMSSKYTPACWSHDFGRQGLIDLDDDDQSTNDYMFRKALRHLGMSDFFSNLIYYFTRSQGWLRDKTGLSATGLVGIIFMVTIFSVMYWHSTTRG
jgi:hypothetical protein